MIFRVWFKLMWMIMRVMHQTKIFLNFLIVMIVMMRNMDVQSDLYLVLDSKTTPCKFQQGYRQVHQEVQVPQVVQVHQ